MQVEQVAIEWVVPYARNPRKNGPAVAKVAASIREFGFCQPIVVDRERVVIGQDAGGASGCRPRTAGR